MEPDIDFIIQTVSQNLPGNSFPYSSQQELPNNFTVGYDTLNPYDLLISNTLDLKKYKEIMPDYGKICIISDDFKSTVKMLNKINLYWIENIFHKQKYYTFFKKLRNFSVPKWQGETIEGNLLLYCEWGYGDTIRNLRFIPYLRNRIKGSVIIEARRGLESLVKQFADVVVKRGDVLPNFNYSSQICNLKFFLDFIPQPPYINVVTNKSSGIGYTHKGHHLTFNPERDFDKSLIVNNFPNSEYLGDNTDWLETAIKIANKQIIISTDTGLAHLSAALNKPTYVLLPYKYVTPITEPGWNPSVKYFYTNGNYLNTMEKIKNQIYKNILL